MSYEPENTWHEYCLEFNPKDLESAITEDHVESNGNKIHLDIYGKDEDLEWSIMFIHGTGMYSRFYTEFLYMFYKKGFRMIGIDLPGHGLSEGKRGHFTMDFLVSTVHDITTHVINKFGENVILMGSSLGGFTSLYAISNDDRIKAGVCNNAAILNEKAHKKIVKLKGIYKALRPLMPFFARILPTFRLSVWIYLNIENLVHDKNLLQIFENFIKKDRLVSDKYTLKSLLTQMKAPLPRPIEGIETPILIINGDDDVLFSVEYMEEVLERLEKSRNKRLEVIPNSAHLIFHEFRDESINRIVKWLKETL